MNIGLFMGYIHGTYLIDQELTQFMNYQGIIHGI